MDVLAVYDIHGNAEALEAVLADPRALGADAVVVGGDAVPGPEGRAVLDRLATLEVPVHWVRGNGEREVAAAVGAAPAREDDQPGLWAEFTVSELGGAEARRLGDLPLTVELDGVLYCHATPRSDEEMVTKLSPPERWVAALAGVDAPLVVAGHTHQQDDRQVGTVRFVNAGSVGLPYEGDGAARWLWVSGGEPSLRATPYDAVGAGRRMLARGFPGGESVAAALTDPVDPLEITRLFEARAGASG
ncbi:MAG TPA: metallophosphoesterase family protein [Solirubrobacteraceae bacterium]|nr:metallophosphoesterase family protein [Solirubrobacteraceae bacterium]